MSEDEIPDVRVLSYGPADNEYHKDAMVGPVGNILKPYQIAISPSMAKEHNLKLGDWVNVGGQDRQIADWSYYHPGEPTENTVEIRDRGHVKEHSPLRVLTQDEIAQKNLPPLDTGGASGRPPLLASAPGDRPTATPDMPLMPLGGDIPDIGDTGDLIRSTIDQQPPRALMAGDVPTDAAVEAAQAGFEGEPSDETDSELPQVQVVQPKEETPTAPPLGKLNRLLDVDHIDQDKGMVYFKNGWMKDLHSNSIYKPDPVGNIWRYDPGRNPVKVSGGTQRRSPDEVFETKAAEKGILPKNYPTRQAYEEAARSTLGGGVAESIVDDMEQGLAPPTLSGLYRYSAPVRAEIAKRNKDRVANGEEPWSLTNAMMDWEAVKKHLSAMNSTQQLRLMQSATTAYHSLDIIDSLSSQWKGGQFPILNKANLIAAKNGLYGQDAQTLANQLDGQIKDLTFELGNVYMGGNTPTDQSLKLAHSNLSSDWSDKTLHDMTNLARRNLGIRIASMKGTGAAGLSEAGQARYGSTEASPSASVAPAGPMPTIKSQADYNALPSGSKYQGLGKDGQMHTFTKP